MMAKIVEFASLECLLELIHVAEQIDSLDILLLHLLEQEHSSWPILRHLLLLLLLLTDHVADIVPIKQSGIA